MGMPDYISLVSAFLGTLYLIFALLYSFAAIDLEYLLASPGVLDNPVWGCLPSALAGGEEAGTRERQYNTGLNLSRGICFRGKGEPKFVSVLFNFVVSLSPRY